MLVSIGYFSEDDTVRSHVLNTELDGYYTEVAIIEVDSIAEAVVTARNRFDMTYGVIVTATGEKFRFGFDVHSGEYKYHEF